MGSTNRNDSSKGVNDSEGWSELDSKLPRRGAAPLVNVTAIRDEALKSAGSSTCEVIGSPRESLR